MEYLPGNIEIFPLAQRCNVGVMLMKPLAGGLLCAGKSFPPIDRLVPGAGQLEAAEILRFILLNHPEVSCVVPGTTSIEEAAENALAGHAPLVLSPERREIIHTAIGRMKSGLCSRCGRCDALCSKKLPVSWLFRDFYITTNRSMIFETLDQLGYQVLHPWSEPACCNCANVTCHCPYGIDIPRELIRIHKQMVAFREKGLLPLPAKGRNSQNEEASPLFSGRLHRKDVPLVLERGQAYVFRFVVQNTGAFIWKKSAQSADVCLLVHLENKVIVRVYQRCDVAPGERAHFAFRMTASSRPGMYRFHFSLLHRSIQSDGGAVDLPDLQLEVL